MYERNMACIEKRISAGLSLLRDHYTIRELPVKNVFKSFFVAGRRHEVKQYEIEGVGNLVVMTNPDAGKMQMDTFTITPYYKNLPLFTTDYMYFEDRRMFLNEIYSLVEYEDELYTEYIKQFAKNCDRLSYLDDFPMKPCWYDNIRPVVIAKNSPPEKDDEIIDLFLENLKTFIEMEKASPLLEEEHLFKKWQADFGYARSLVEDGGVSTDLFVKTLGAENTKRFFYSVFFAPYRYGNDRFQQRIHRLNGNTWRIEDGGVRFFLLEGEKDALLIDSGMNSPDAKEIAESVTDLPLKLINTHSDPDHISGNGAFEEIMMHTDEAANYKIHDGKAVIISVSDGSILDLGRRPLEIIALPGHTPGSIAILDVKSRILFGGDAIQDGHIFMFGKHRSFPEYAQSLRSLVEKHGKEFDAVFPSHGSVTVSPDLIPRLADAADAIIGGTALGTPAEIFGQQITMYDFGFVSFLGEPK